MQVLTKHEDNHKNKYAEYATTLKSQALAIPAQPKSTLESKLKSINEKIKKDIHNWNVDYDKKTKYGVTEGLVIKSC